MHPLAISEQYYLHHFGVVLHPLIDYESTTIDYHTLPSYAELCRFHIKSVKVGKNAESAKVRKTRHFSAF